jgi:lysophospholipase L1-like esterase
MRLILVLLFTFFTLMSSAQQPEKKFLALGDSYTIGESVAESERWPVQLIGKLNASGERWASPDITATTGWRTDDLKKAILARNPEHDYDLVSLLIGVNNQYQGKSVQEYIPQFEELLAMAISFAGGDRTKVFVVSIPDYGYTPFGKAKQEQISKELDEFNSANKTIADRYGVRYFNITPVSRQGFTDPGLVATDGLHPSGKMYAEWVKIILEGIR